MKALTGWRPKALAKDIRQQVTFGGFAAPKEMYSAIAGTHSVKRVLNYIALERGHAAIRRSEAAIGAHNG